jgi:hypothetical protein
MCRTPYPVSSVTPPPCLKDQNFINLADFFTPLLKQSPEALFIVPGWGDKVDNGIKLSYRPVKLHAYRLTGRYDNPMPYSTFSPSKGQRIWLQVTNRKAARVES